MNGAHNSYVVTKLLLWREFKIIADSLGSVVGSGMVYSVLLALTAAYFMPQMGLAPEGILPLFLGSFSVSCITLAYAGAIDVAYDLRSPRLGAYHAMLPVPFAVIVSAKVAVLMVRIGVVALPVLVGGLCIVHRWHSFSVSIVGTIVMIFLAILFNALLFLSLAHWCSIAVLLGNIWPRFISPLFALGCSMYPWRAVAQRAPLLSQVLLINPLTYCIEGLRSALLGGDHFISWEYCAGVLVILNIVLCAVLWRVMVRALNPVVMGRGSVCK